MNSAFFIADYRQITRYMRPIPSLQSTYICRQVKSHLILEHQLRQATPFINHVPAVQRFSSRESFMESVNLLQLPILETIRVTSSRLWLQSISSTTPMPLNSYEELPVGAKCIWRDQKRFNTLRTGKGCCNVEFSSTPCSIFSSILCQSKYAQLKNPQPTMMLHCAYISYSRVNSERILTIQDNQS